MKSVLLLLDSIHALSISSAEDNNVELEKKCVNKEIELLKTILDNKHLIEKLRNSKARHLKEYSNNTNITPASYLN